MFNALFSLIVSGDYVGGMYTHFGIDEDSPLVHAVLTVRALFTR